MKFKSRLINIKNKNNIIMIVGICPGNQKRSYQTNEVFHGNRTGDFIENLIKDIPNIYLTNVFNYKRIKKLSKEEIEFGSKELKKEIKKIKPKKIICLGLISKEVINNIVDSTKIKIINLRHPSYILRFNNNIKKYKEEFKKELLNEN